MEETNNSADEEEEELAILGDAGMVAQARVKIHTEKLVSQEHAREQTVMHRIKMEQKENTLSFISQQNMLSRQLTVGMRNRLKVHQQQKTVATVQARREVAHQRRHQVIILFENFNRRRQVTHNANAQGYCEARIENS
jgi:hypothetical protein